MYTGPFVGRMEGDIKRDPEQQRGWIKEKRKSDREDDGGDLHLEDREVGEGDQANDNPDGQKLGEDQVDDIRSEKIAGFICVLRSAIWTPILDIEPAREDIGPGAIRTMPSQRTVTAGEQAFGWCGGDVLALGADSIFCRLVRLRRVLAIGRLSLPWNTWYIAIMQKPAQAKVGRMWLAFGAILMRAVDRACKGL